MRHPSITAAGLAGCPPASGLAKGLFDNAARQSALGASRINNVEASVIEGDYPSIVLLGMTYLRHVKMEERDGVLTLSQSALVLFARGFSAF